jgi:hypothetical protein
MSTATADFEQLVALLEQLDDATPSSNTSSAAADGKMDPDGPR